MKKGLIYLHIGMLIGLVVGCFPNRPIDTSSTPLPSSPSVSATNAATPDTGSPTAPTPSDRTNALPRLSTNDQLVAQQPECANPQTQSEMNTCAAKAASIADEKLNEAYQKLRATVDGEESDLLISAQRAWIDFRDKNCQFSSNRFEGGSIEPMVYSSCIERVTKQRTEELENYAKGIEDGGLY
jgi:uncharacterized protein YecT (DUF1311 family)